MPMHGVKRGGRVVRGIGVRIRSGEQRGHRRARVKNRSEELLSEKVQENYVR